MTMLNNNSNTSSWAQDSNYNENNSSTTIFNLLNQITSDSFYNFMTFAAPYPTQSSIDSYSSLSTSSSSLSCSHSSIVGSTWPNSTYSEAQSSKTRSFAKQVSPPPGFELVNFGLDYAQDKRANKFNKNSKTKLFVGNLPSDTTLEELINLFSKYGRVNEQLSIVKQDHYAFVHFYHEPEAVDALNNLNNSLFKNRYIRVQYSTSYGHIKKSKTFDLNWQSNSSKSKMTSNNLEKFDRFLLNEQKLTSYLEKQCDEKFNNKVQIMSGSKSIASLSSISKSKDHKYLF